MIGGAVGIGGTSASVGAAMQPAEPMQVDMGNVAEKKGG